MDYARVPSEMQPLLLRDIRRRRLHGGVLYFPILVLIFSALAAGFVFTKGHVLLRLLREALQDHVSETAFWIGIAGAVVICVAGGLVLLLRAMYRECKIERLFYCEACKAVDDTRGHVCPCCQRELRDQADFFGTPYKDEWKIVNRFGFVLYKDS